MFVPFFSDLITIFLNYYIFKKLRKQCHITSSILLFKGKFILFPFMENLYLLEISYLRFVFADIRGCAV